MSNWKQGLVFWMFAASVTTVPGFTPSGPTQRSGSDTWASNAMDGSGVPVASTPMRAVTRNWRMVRPSTPNPLTTSPDAICEVSTPPSMNTLAVPPVDADTPTEALMGVVDAAAVSLAGVT